MPKNDDYIDKLFEELEGSFDYETPKTGHAERFLKKIKAQGSEEAITLHKPKIGFNHYWAIAASLIILFGLGFLFVTINTEPSINTDIENSQYYFTSVINEQIETLKSETTPETKAIIDDALIQIEKLEQDYELLEQKLPDSENNNMILKAMIINFQTRIDLLKDVLDQIETIKTLKDNNYEENIT